MTASVVYETGGYPLPGAEIDWPTDGSFPLEVVESVDPRALDGTSLMIAITAADPSGLERFPDYPLPGAETDWPTAGEFSVIGAAATYYVAAQRGITTLPEDTPANTVIPGKMANKLNFSTMLFRDTDPMQGNQVQAAQAGYGGIRLMDPDGGLDYLADLSLDGAWVEIYRGRHEQLRSSWTRIARMSAQGALYDGNIKDIRLRDASWKLDRGEIQPERYTGAGGREGDSSVRGVVKPYAVGYVFNVPALTINSLLLIAQLSNSSIYAVYDVRDGGTSLTFSADYSTYEALAAAVVPNGFYATCLALGMIRLGATPTKQITADLCGDNDFANGRGRPLTRSDIVRRIACGLGSLRFDPSAELDQNAFRYMDDYYPDELGYFWNEAIFKADAIREVMSGVSGYAAVRFDGNLTIGPARLPEDTEATFLSLRHGQSFKSVPRLLSYTAPRLATFIGWQRNYTPQSRDQLQTGVPEAAALIYSNPLRVEGSVSGENATIWPTSQNVVVNGGFRYQAAAGSEAARQQTIFGVRRDRWGVEVPMDQYTLALGRKAQVLDWPRYNFAAGRSLRVVGMSANDALNVQLELWG